MTQDRLETEMLSNPVRNLQFMLRRLASKYPNLPQLAEDGIFGAETLESVLIFQRDFDLPVTGMVDQRTWDTLVKEWTTLEREVSPARTLQIFPGGGHQVLPGEGGDYMILPQTMFQVLSRYLEGIAEDTADGVHGTVSVENTKWLQQLAQLEETGIMDRATWDALSRLYELFVTSDTGKNK